MRRLAGCVWWLRRVLLLVGLLARHAVSFFLIDSALALIARDDLKLRYRIGKIFCQPFGTGQNLQFPIP